MSRVFFLPVVFGLTYGFHYYIWARLVRDTALPPPYRALATVAIVLLGASLPAAFATARLLRPSLAHAIAWPAYLWLGLMFFLLVLLLVGDVGRLVALATAMARAGRPDDPTRRLFLHRLLGAATAAAATGVSAIAVRSALSRVEVREVTVALPRLPAALDGTTVVQLTDVHIGGGPTLGRAFIADLVRRTNALQPDIVAITGDLVDGPVASLREAVAPLAELRARHGVFFVTGNHEYYSGADAWLAELRRLGIRPLRNERVSVGDGAHSFDLAGIDDHSSHGSAPGHGPDLPRALDGRDPSRELVLLAHQPRAIHEAKQHGVGLQLSGHTHGGQIWPFVYLVRLQQPYTAGLVREGETQLYVSRGTGFWGPPMRLRAPAEITKIVLRRAA
jgi:predicted MPP superfamily phosphohydrolase